MIHVPINVTGWVQGENLRRCDLCSTLFHKLYTKCPKCQSPNISVVPEPLGGKGRTEALIPVLDNAQ